MVPKSQRTPTKVRHVVMAKKLRLALTKFLCKDFGATKSYKTTKVFIDSNQVAPEKAKELNKKIDDINEFLEGCGGRAVLEASFPYFIIEDERKRFLDLLFDLDKEIAFGESMYPTSEFLLNKKLTHIQNSINIAETIVNEFDHCIHTFGAKNTDMSKFDWYLDLMRDLIYALKDWRSKTNKFREICIHSDIEIQSKVKFSIEHGIKAHNTSGDMRNVKEYNKEARIARGDLKVDENGKCLKPEKKKKPKKAVIFLEEPFKVEVKPIKLPAPWFNELPKKAVEFVEPFKVEVKPIKLPAPGFTELPRPAVIFDDSEKIYYPTFNSKVVLST